METIQENTNRRNKTRGIDWLEAILLGLCGGLLCLVVDMALHLI